MAWNLWVSDANVASKCNSSPGWIAGFTSGETAEANKVNTALRQANLVAVALMDALGLNSYSYSTAESTLKTAIKSKIPSYSDLKININGDEEPLGEAIVYAPSGAGDALGEIPVWNSPFDRVSWMKFFLLGRLNGISSNDVPIAITSIYAPEDSGTSGQILQSNGANQAPTWVDSVPNATNTDFTNASWTEAPADTMRVAVSSLVDGASYQIFVNDTANGEHPSGIFVYDASSYTSNSRLRSTIGVFTEPATTGRKLITYDVEIFILDESYLEVRRNVAEMATSANLSSTKVPFKYRRIK